MSEQPVEKQSESIETVPVKVPFYSGKSSSQNIQATKTNELVIALCAPIGVDVSEIYLTIRQLLQAKSIDCKLLKISKIIQDLVSDLKIDAGRNIERKKELIRAGDKICEVQGNDFLAEKVVSDIFSHRAKERGDSETFSSLNVCYVVDSLKRLEEYDLLKELYGDIFYMVGVYTDKDSRIKALIKNSNDNEVEAAEVIEEDYNGNPKHGQNVRKLFPKSDVFVPANNGQRTTNYLNRFFDLVFGSKLITPTIEERAMYVAWSAGLNSACISRQVGASITNSGGSIIGLGWNDVPKFGGGVYTNEDKQFEDSDKDRRCYNFVSKKGFHCRNYEEQQILAEHLTSILKSKGIIKPSEEAKVKALLYDSRLKDLIEFSRAVHAEMHALFNAMEKEGSVKGGKVFVTTYPCHNCAKHIIMAGIREVYFIEPYPKSKALKLHEDELTESTSDTKVELKPFLGISPSRYLELFTTSDREIKKDGQLDLKDDDKVFHRRGKSLEALWALETVVTKKYSEKYEKNPLIKLHEDEPSK